MRRQHDKPCGDCPWRRNSAAGWLGRLSPIEWVRAVGGEGEIRCHTRPMTRFQCAGAAIYRTNTAKSPRDPRLLLLPRDTERVFANPIEFMKHHEGRRG